MKLETLNLIQIYDVDQSLAHSLVTYSTGLKHKVLEIPS